MQTPAVRFFILVFSVTFVLASVVLYVATNKVFATAGINRQISFQGKLVNPDGTNLADGTYTVVFKLYDAASSGTNLWTETQSVTTTDGIFRVSLGSVTTFASAGVDFNSDALYLGVKVGSDAEMTPRIRFASVPYAFNAEKVSGLTVTNTTGTFTLANSKTLTVNNTLTLSGTDSTSFTFPSTTGGTVITSNAPSQSITSTQTTGDVFTFTDSSLALGGSATGNVVKIAYTNNSTNTSGTATTVGLQIAGTNSASGTSGTMDTYGIKIADILGTPANGTQNNYGIRIGNQGQSGAEKSYGLYVDAQSGSTSNYSAYFGNNVGIGTATPGGTLQVTGTTFLNGGLDVGDTAYYDSSVAFSVKSNRSYLFNMYNNAVSPVLALTQAGKLTVGDLSGGSLFNVVGGASIGGTYYLTAAPTDGLLVEGNVGIGSSSPTAKLDVTGTGKFSSTLTLSSLSANGVVYTDGSKGLTSTAPTSGTLGYWARSGTTISPATNTDTVAVGSSNQLTIDSSGNLATSGTVTATGNIGIGTTSPGFSLAFGNGSNRTIGVDQTAVTVAGKTLTISAGAGGDHSGGSSAGAGATLFLNGGAGGVGVGAGGAQAGNGGNIEISGGNGGSPSATANVGGSIYLVGGTAVGSSVGNVYMGITSGGTARGNVGIGTTTVSGGLLTVGTSGGLTINSSGAITAATGIASSGTINFSGLTASTGVYTDGSKNLTSTAPTSGVLGYFSRTGSALTPSNSGDSIATTGNVGVGTTTVSSNALSVMGGNIGLGTTNASAQVQVNAGADARPLLTLYDDAGTPSKLFEFTNPTGTMVNGLSFIPAATTARPQILAQGSDTNIGLDIDSKGTGAINIGTSSNAKTITIGSQTGATALNFTSGTGPQTFTSSVVSTSGNSSAFVFAGNSVTTGTASYFTSSSITQGKLVDINTSTANTLTTGTLLNVSNQSTALTTGSLLALDWTPGSSVTNTATGDLVKLTIGANGANNGVNFLNFYSGSSSVFSVNQQQFATSLPTAFTAPGDVSVAYDLSFTNPTASYIKTAAPLTIQSGETFNSSDLTLTTFNNGNINFNAGNSTRMIVNGSTGNVGIGTTTLSNVKLTLYGGSGSGATYLSLKNEDTSGREYLLGSTGGANGQGVGKFVIWDNTAGANRLTIDSAGNVGINTTSAASTKLQIDSTADTQVYLSSSGPSIKFGNNATLGSTTMNGILAQATAASQYGLSAGDFLLGAYGNSRGNIYINSNYSGTGTTNVIIQPSTGNVGIGSTAPAAQLHLRSTSAGLTSFTGTTIGNFLIENDINSADKYSTIDFRNTTYAASSNPIARIGAQLTGSGTLLHFGVSNAYASGITSDAMIIKYDGNVSIGTTTATARLYALSSTNTATTNIVSAMANNATWGTALNFGGIYSVGSNGNNALNINAQGTGNIFMAADSAGGSASTGNVSIGTTASTKKLLVHGDIAAGGTAGTAGDYYDASIPSITAAGTLSYSATGQFGQATSDRRLKENIVYWDSSYLDKFMQLKPTSFDFINGPKNQTGFIAQDLLEVFPQVVRTNPTDGYYNFDKQDLVPYIVKAVQDLNAKVDNQGNLTANIHAQTVTANAITTSTLSTGRLTIIDEDGASSVAIGVERGNIVIKNATGDPTISIDKETGNAYFAGEVVAKTIRAEKIIGIDVLTNRVASLSAELANLQASQSANSATNSSQLAINLNGAFIQNASTSSELKIDRATFVENLTSVGHTFLADTNIAGMLTVGTLSISDIDNSINAVGDLKIQNGPLAGNVDLFNGKILLSQTGDVKIEGTIEAKHVKTQALTILDDAQEATVSGAIAGTSAGKAQIVPLTTVTTVTTSALHDNSLIFVTAEDLPVAVSAKKTTPTTFDISLKEATTSAITVNWWIVNTEPIAQAH